jgi:hypothetical protein
MSSGVSDIRRTAMRTTGMLAVALAAMFAMGAVFTPAEAGGARRVERRDSMPAQPTNVAPGGGVAFDKAKDVRGKLDQVDKDLQASDKLGNFEIQRSNSVPARPINVAPISGTAKDKDLQSQDKMGNFQIQGLMSDFNEAQTLSK